MWCAEAYFHFYCHKEISLQTLKFCASSSTNELYFVRKKLTAQQEDGLYLCRVDMQKNTKTAAYVYGPTNHHSQSAGEKYAQKYRR